MTLDKRLPVADALEQGLILVDGEGADTMRELIAAALSAPVASAAATQPVRLFGPTR